MSGKTARVTVNKYGDTKIDVEGFTGTGCVEATQAIELALGGGGKRNLKPEFDQPESTEQAAEATLRF